MQSVSSAAPINAWAAKATNGLITQAVPANLDFNTLITNAVYFKGQWEYAFDKTLTKKRDFTAATSSGASKVSDTCCLNHNTEDAARGAAAHLHSTAFRKYECNVFRRVHLHPTRHRCYLRAKHRCLSRGPLSLASSGCCQHALFMGTMSVSPAATPNCLHCSGPA